MGEAVSIVSSVEDDIWDWLNTFVTVKNAFYDNKFAPCPYALAAVRQHQVDVVAYDKGDVRSLIRQKSAELRDAPALSTRVIAFPPRVQYQWGLSGYVETLNAELIPGGVFLNTGVTKTKASRYPGSNGDDPYFIVVANRLGPVLDGARALARTTFYDRWPKAQYELVVERRERMARRYGAPSFER